MTAVLTRICEEVVKTAAIRKFSHAPMLGPSSPSSPDPQLLLLKSCPSGVSLEWDLRMTGVLTISTLIVVKTAAIGNLGPGVHA